MGRKTKFPSGYSQMALVSLPTYNRFIAYLQKDMEEEEVQHLKSLNEENGLNDHKPPIMSDVEFAKQQEEAQNEQTEQILNPTMEQEEEGDDFVSFVGGREDKDDKDETEKEEIDGSRMKVKVQTDLPTLIDRGVQTDLSMIPPRRNIQETSGVNTVNPDEISLPPDSDSDNEEDNNEEDNKDDSTDSMNRPTKGQQGSSPLKIRHRTLSQFRTKPYSVPNIPPPTPNRIPPPLPPPPSHALNIPPPLAGQSKKSTFCHLCGNTYSSTYSLKRHIFTQHKKGNYRASFSHNNELRTTKRKYVAEIDDFPGRPTKLAKEMDPVPEKGIKRKALNQSERSHFKKMKSIDWSQSIPDKEETEVEAEAEAEKERPRRKAFQKAMQFPLWLQ